MNKRDALKVLIERIDLEPEQKKILLEHLQELTDESVMELGVELANYRVQQMKAARRTIKAIDDLLATEQS